jgi:hypothetical protein
MKKYSYSKASAKKISGKHVLKLLPFFIIAGFSGLYFANIDSGGMLFKDIPALVLAVLVLASLLVTSLILGMKLRIKKLLNERYILTDAYLEKEIFKGNSIKIALNNVEFHLENTKGLLLTSKDITIQLPKELDGYKELKIEIIEKIKNH